MQKRIIKFKILRMGSKSISSHKEWLYPLLLLGIPFLAAFLGEFLLDAYSDFLNPDNSNSGNWIGLILAVLLAGPAMVLAYPSVAVLYFVQWTVLSFLGIEIGLPYDSDGDFSVYENKIDIPMFAVFLLDYLIYWYFYSLYLRKERRIFKKGIIIFSAFLVIMGLALVFFSTLFY